jgi:hypothetical protein
MFDPGWFGLEGLRTAAVGESINAVYIGRKDVL